MACFHARTPSFYQPSPKAYAPGSFSYDSSAPSELLRVHLPAGAFRRWASTVTQVSSLFSTSLNTVHSLRGFLRPRYGSALRLSQPLNGFLRYLALQAYCILQPGPGFSSVQGIPIPCSSSNSSLVRLPPCRSTYVSSLASQLPLPQASTSRLSSAWSRVVCSLALTSLKLAPFFGFVSLPGALPNRRYPGLPWAIHS